MKKSLFTLGLLLIGGCWGVTSCSPKPPTAAIVVKWDNTLPVEKFTDTISTKLLVLSGALLGRIDRIVWFNDRYYIVDKQTQTVAAFDSLGRFLFNIGRKGRGPGEYVNLGDLSIDRANSQILLYLDRPHSLMYFDLDGNYLSSRSLEGVEYSYSVLPSEEYLYLNEAGTKNLEPIPYSLTVLNSSDLSVVNRVKRQVMSPYSIVCGGTQVEWSNGRWLWTCPFDFTIREFKDGSAIDLYRVDFGDRAFPERYISQEVLNAAQMQDKLINNNYLIGITSVVETPKYIFFRSNSDQYFAIEKQTSVLRQYKSFEYGGKASPLSSGALMPVEGFNGRIAFVIESWLVSYLASAKDIPLDSVTQSVLSTNVDMNPVLILADVR